MSIYDSSGPGRPFYPAGSPEPGEGSAKLPRNSPDTPTLRAEVYDVLASMIPGLDEDEQWRDWMSDAANALLPLIADRERAAAARALTDAADAIDLTPLRGRGYAADWLRARAASHAAPPGGSTGDGADMCKPSAKLPGNSTHGTLVTGAMRLNECRLCGSNRCFQQACQDPPPPGGDDDTERSAPVSDETKALVDRVLDHQGGWPASDKENTP